MIKVLEHVTHKERLRKLDLFSLGKISKGYLIRFCKYLMASNKDEESNLLEWYLLKRQR